MSSVRIRLSILMAAVLASTGLIDARQQSPGNRIQSLALTDPMPVDPMVTKGTFANGLRYYVRSNNKAEKRAQLRLVVKAGSVLEEEDQRGLAHVAEHMAFNGTTRFPKKEIETFIQSLGMQFGADLNAGTGYDQTIYMLRVPTDSPDTMDRALMILADWAHNVTFDAADIDNERKIVMEEWRLRRGAGTRTGEKIDPIWYKGTPYAERLPIGKPEVIQNFKPERLKKFYTDWYRPDLMAVVAVGDFDKGKVEELVRKHFASIPAATSPRPRPYYEVPDHPGVVYATATDKEATGTWVEIDNLLPGRTMSTVGSYRQRIVDNLFASMLGDRFNELTQKPDPPFLFAYATRGIWGGRTCETCNPREDAWLYADVKDNGAERGLEALVMEASRVSRFGFTATELERTKQAVLRNSERRALDDINRTHDSRVNDYIGNFLDNRPIPTAADEYALHQRFLPEITIAEINRLAAEWFPEGNRFVTVVAPEKSGVAVPDEKKLAAVIKDASTKELKPYVDSIGNASLMDTLPVPGTVVKTSSKTAVDITEWELSNGAKVVLKPTTFSEDQIILRATSPGGTSLSRDADYIPASTAAQVVTAGGLGKFNAIDLQKILTGKLAGANPFIAEMEEGLTGNSSRKDLETMFQLVYLRFTQPRADATAVSVQAELEKAGLANQNASPDFAFNRTFTALRTQDHLRRRVTTAETIDEWNLSKSLAFYKDRFADASDFTFVLVGSFDLPTIKPLVERYLSSLPSTHRKETWKDVGVKTPNGVVEKNIEKGIEPRSRSTIQFNGPFNDTEANRITLQAMAQILNRRLMEVIREQLGGAYTISAGQGVQRIPRPEYNVTIQWGHDPKQTTDMVKRILQEIDLFKANGPTDTQMKDQKEAMLRTFETSIKQNNYWLNQITQSYRFKEDPARILNVPDQFKKLDRAMIQQAARTYLNTNRYLRVTLLPE